MQNGPCIIPFEALIDLQEGRLPTDDAAELGRHVAAGCPRCAASLRWLGETLPHLAPALQLSSSETATPSADALAYVHRLARLLQPVKEVEAVGAAGRLTRFVARLVAGGTPPRPIAAGARGGGDSEPVQRVYRTEAHLITLWDEPEDNSGIDRYLIGQVYGDDGAARIPRSATLLLSDAAEREAQREGSEFHLAAIPPGQYLVRCVLLDTDEEIFLPGVRVGAA